MSTKANVLFLECGSSGLGGSYLSLKDHIQIMADCLGKKIIVLTNKSLYEDEYRALGCEVIYIKHPIYSKNASLKWIFNKSLSLSTRISSRAVYFIYRLFELSFARKLAGIAKKNDINLLHLNNQPLRNLGGFIAARKLQLNVVSHIRTLHTYGFSVAFAKYLNHSSTRFVSISKAVEDEWGRYSIESDVVFNPVIIKKTDASVEKKYDLIYVGRLVKGKGLEKLLEEISLFSPQPRLAILGDGFLKKELMDLVNHLELSASVFFLDHVKNVSPYILHSKVLVLPTENEGMGRVIIEAMKLGVPVIANQVGGVKELIKDETTGLLYDANIKGEFHRLAQSLLGNEALRKKLSESASEWVGAHFSTVKYKESMTRLYENQTSVSCRIIRRGKTWKKRRSVS